MQNKTLTSTNDLEGMVQDYNEETKSNLDCKISYVKIPFPISHKLCTYIVNIYPYEDVNKQIGHWITLITKGKNVIVYTCFGLFSFNLLNYLIQQGYTDIVFDMKADQPLNSKSCGFYCLRYIIDKEYNKLDNYIRFENDKLYDKKIDTDLMEKLDKNNDIYHKTLQSNFKS